MHRCWPGSFITTKWISDRTRGAPCLVLVNPEATCPKPMYKLTCQPASQHVTNATQGHYRRLEVITTLGESDTLLCSVSHITAFDPHKNNSLHRLAVPELWTEMQNCSSVHSLREHIPITFHCSLQTASLCTHAKPVKE